MTNPQGVELAPPPVARVASAVPGLALCAGALAYLAEAGNTGRGAAAVLVLLVGGVLAVRGSRMGVRCEGERLLVRGLVRSRSVPRAAVTGITGFPAVRWTSANGRRRWTPVTAFVAESGQLTAVRDHHLRNTARLRRWAARGGR